MTDVKCEEAKGKASSPEDCDQLKRALDESRGLLDSLIKYVPGGVFKYSAEPDEEFTFLSENMLSLLGYTKEEFEQTFDNRFSQMVYEEDRVRVLAEIEEQIARGPYDTCRYRIRKKDGSLIWVHDEGHIVTDEKGHRWFYVTIVDITGSMEESRVLSEHTSELEQMIERIPTGIRVFHKVGGTITCVACNPYCSVLLGTPHEELVGETIDMIMKRVHPDDLERCYEETTALLDKNKNTSGTYRIYNTQTETYGWVHVEGCLVHQKSGEEYAYLCYSDATAQKRTEEDYDRALQQLLAGNPQTLCSFKLNLSENRCESGHGTSPFVQGLLAAATADKLFDNIASLIVDPHDRDRFRKTFNRKGLIESFRRGENAVSESYRRRMEDGDIHWVTTRISLVQNPYTGDIEAVASSTDSEDMMIEDRIVRHLTSKECDYIGLIDPDARTFEFRNVNAKLMEFPLRKKLPYGKCIEYDINRFVVPEDAEIFRQYSAIDNIVAKLDESDDYSFVYRHHEQGMTMYKSLRYGHLDQKGGDILVIQSDITASYEQEREQMRRLQEAYDTAKKADEAKSEFLSRMSHDIRTPMNGIIGMTRIAREYDNPPQTVECLDKIDTSSRFLLGLVNDILDLSKVESGAVVLHLEPYHSEDFFAYMEAVIRPLCDQKGLKLQVGGNVVKDVLPLMDELRSNQIAFNLLSNAVKFTPEGGTVSLFLDEKMVDSTHMYMTATIGDDGIGMSEEFQQVLFEPFTQEGGTRTVPGQGTGLGLAIAKKMADLMGGTITVESAPGKGTTFTLSGVLECVPLETAAPSNRTAGDVTERLAGKKVLLVEDHPLNTEIAVALLEKVHIAVTTAEDGRHGLDCFIASPVGYYDAILMDIRMPVMDGYEAAAAIRALDRTDAQVVPIIAMTADVYTDDVAHSRAAGMAAHVAKPVDPERLYQVLSDVCG